jgi:hypothetical protein
LLGLDDGTPVGAELGALLGESLASRRWTFVAPSKDLDFDEVVKASSLEFMVQ